jgi:hypothetical protein
MRKKQAIKTKILSKIFDYLRVKSLLGILIVYN